jgi:hypothetical protein
VDDARNRALDNAATADAGTPRRAADSRYCHVRISGSNRAAALACLCLVAAPAFVGGPPLTVRFSQCSEFVGLVPVDAAKAQALLPPRYALVVDGPNTARMVVRMIDCKAIRVGAFPARAGRLAQAGASMSDKRQRRTGRRDAGALTPTRPETARTRWFVGANEKADPEVGFCSL